ncbi:MAG TPA: hypothetical protein VIJ78_04245 [Pseudolabrys sp.]
MVAVTYGLARVGAADSVPKAAPKIAPKIAPKTATADQAPPRKSWFARFFYAVVQTRMQQARHEIRTHTNLLPYSFDERGNRLVEKKSDGMPLGGW